ncbi:MAG: class I SAM-dependent methyltransferase, partial [Proteobacteria bacterium]|nr:class I SAM-dependent methyltransferase [Pseudomonadota bacterium]
MFHFIRNFLKKIHPEGIPGPGAYVYNLLSCSDIFQKHYDFIAQDISSYETSGKVLDIGTGPAWLLIKLNKINPLFDLSGIDISEAMIEKARENIK